jgi:hypothetical protein
MKLWEKLSGIIYKLIALPYVKAFEGKNTETVLKKSVYIMDADAVESIKNYIKSRQTTSGGFPDKAGKADLYYTLFGFYLADALDLKELFPSIQRYIEKEIAVNDPAGIHLYCAAILYAKIGKDHTVRYVLQKKVRLALRDHMKKQPAYTAFLTLLACYYLEDYKGLYMIRKQIRTFNKTSTLPCPVIAALLVLQQSFHKPVEELKTGILSFYAAKGGFRATPAAPVPDLLSTAVALYALYFAGADLRMIRPDCLQFVEALYNEGGFSVNVLDPDPYIEYTFYGLLTLGALAESGI